MYRWSLCPEPYSNKFSLFILLPFGPTRLIVAAVSEVHAWLIFGSPNEYFPCWRIRTPLKSVPWHMFGHPWLRYLSFFPLLELILGPCISDLYQFYFFMISMNPKLLMAVTKIETVFIRAFAKNLDCPWVVYSNFVPDWKSLAILGPSYWLVY